MEKYYLFPEDGQETRWFTWENKDGLKGQGGKTRCGRKGSPYVVIKPGESVTLCEIKGSGTIRRIWGVLYKRHFKHLRGLVIEMYWENSETPAVRAPIGDFFGHAGGKMAAFENALFASGEGRSFLCNAAMPFKSAAKIIVRNEDDEENSLYYEVDATVGDKHPENILYFHAYWRRENPTKLRQDYTILPELKGKGRFIGCSIGVNINKHLDNFWWGEGEVKVYLDGDNEYPTLCGTGTEDYIATGYGQGVFSNLYSGNIIEEANKFYSFYRYHLPDPVWFYSDCRVTIQVMGGPSYKALYEALEDNPGLKLMKGGEPEQWYTKEELLAKPEWTEVMERTDDYCSTAYWYMTKPEDNLGAIVEIKDRIARPVSSLD